VAVISMLAEGSSIHAIERITGIHGDTIGRLALRVGEACKKIMDEKMRNLTCKQVEVDEIWGFIRSPNLGSSASSTKPPSAPPFRNYSNIAPVSLTGSSFPNTASSGRGRPEI
jgi:hypothetical protein